MGKHKTINGIKMTAGKGVTFSKKPSLLNQCVGEKMKGQEFDGRTGVQQALVQGMYDCGANIKDETIKKFGIRKTPAKRTPAKK